MTYHIDDMTLHTRHPLLTYPAITLAQSLWTLARALIVFETLYIARGLPVQWFIGAVAVSWLIWELNQ